MRISKRVTVATVILLLDLNSWINEPSPEQSPFQSDQDDNDDQYETLDAGRRMDFGQVQSTGAVVDQPRKTKEPSTAELKKIREARKAELENNPHYLKSSKMTSSTGGGGGGGATGGGGGGVSSSSSNRSLSKSSGSVTSATTATLTIGQNRSISGQFSNNDSMVNICKLPEITCIDLQSPLDIPGE
uniref:AP-3 complex subunit delta domain-containing protein n=1 Tax=Romanomermis culicivorax TaxID=13658 RepID=A0A915KDG6_ROMCU